MGGKAVSPEELRKLASAISENYCAEIDGKWVGCSDALRQAADEIERLKRERKDLWIALVLIKNAGTEDPKKLKQMAADWADDAAIGKRSGEKKS